MTLGSQKLFWLRGFFFDLAGNAASEDVDAFAASNPVPAGAKRSWVERGGKRVVDDIAGDGAIGMWGRTIAGTGDDGSCLCVPLGTEFHKVGAIVWIREPLDERVGGSEDEVRSVRRCWAGLLLVRCSASS